METIIQMEAIAWRSINLDNEGATCWKRANVFAPDITLGQQLKDSNGRDTLC